MALIDRESLLEKFQFRIEPHGVEGETIQKCVEMSRGIIMDEPVVKDINVPSWIPVTERLPEMHTKVLCCGIRGGRFIAELTTWGKGNLRWDKRNGRGSPEVTHWMPLPEPPKED